MAKVFGSKGQPEGSHEIMPKEIPDVQSGNLARTELEERLFQLFQKKAFLTRQPGEEPFRLTSGKLSYKYFDCKMVTFDPGGINLIAEILLERIYKNPSKVEAIGGLEIGAIPIATAVSQLSELKGKPIPAFFVRQERKEHGTKKWVEGNLEPGSKVVIVDDVTTKGGSVGKAIEKVEELHCKVLEIITLVDREEGAAEKFKNYRFTPIFKMSQFTALD
jgi:orotate phosphoribosyltransferase